MNNVKYLILACIACVFCMGCKEMDSTYKEYVIPNGIIYTGKVLSPIVKSGYNQAQISWNRGTDPKVVKARIYWNYYKDSVDVDMTSMQAVVSHVIDNLEENYYTFIIKTMDSQGNSSVPVEVSGAVLGERYRSTLVNRPISSKLNVNNTVTFSLESVLPSSTVVKSEIEYTTVNGDLKSISIDALNNSITIDDYKLGTFYKIKTQHLEPTAFQAVYSLPQSYEVNKLNKSEWQIVGYSSFYNTDTPAKMIDGNTATRWGTLSPHVYPHYFTVDFGVVRTFDSFSLWRQTPSNEEGPNEVQFLGSNDNINFVDIGKFSFNRFTNNEQKYTLQGVHTYRYVKVVQLNGPKGYVVMGEFDTTVKN